MKLGSRLSGIRSKTSEIQDAFGASASAPLWGFFLLIGIYLVGYFMVRFVSTSDGFLLIGGARIAYRSLTGVTSSLCNLCILLLVVFYRKWGLIVSLAMMVLSVPMMVVELFRGNYSVIPGFFTNILTLTAALLIYIFMQRAGKYQQKLQEQAVTERTTGLPNRFAVTELMNTLIQKNEPFALAVINLNHFKSINNALGQQSANDALCQIGSRWLRIAENGSSGTRDFVACHGGNEFLILLRDWTSDEQLQKSLECYAAALKEKIIVDDVDFVLSAAIGCAVFPGDAGNPEDLADKAYSAMIRAKQTDHNGCILRFSPEMFRMDRFMETERKIRSALDNNRVFFVLQPQYDMSHQLRGFEALARFRDADGTLVDPENYVPVAEKAGLVDRIDHTVLFLATEFFGKAVRETGSDAILCVNASVRHLMRSSFIDEVKTALSRSGLSPSQLEIEITESVMIDSVEEALNCISRLTEMGVHVAIDDFGTGYSSLSYLNTFPVDILKVDQSFIRNLDSGEDARQFVAAIIAIGHVMHFRILAEGIENQQQLDVLREIGCDYIQGFLWGRPMCPEEAAKLLAS
ncbi:MAG: bifunctional diguanylate cyclase/phosphodiesterase [Clostridia bacterium]|nr:bifunctional diguanylate cyclase/phosphodiesterase [Clostridia bacterium]